MIDVYQQVAVCLRRGAVVAVLAGGRVQIRDENSGRLFVCDLLRLTAGPPPEVTGGRDVIFVAEDDDEHGYILGVIEAPTTAEPECVAPGDDGVETPTVVALRAEHRLELTCGRASLTMNADGTVVLKGTTVISRASGVNKIRGAAVRIN
jgi:hypothetical protein